MEQFAYDEHAAGSDDGEPHGLLLCLYRADIPILPPEEPITRSSGVASS